MSKTIFKLWSIRCMSITTQPLQGHQAVIAEYLHQVLTEYPHTHRLAAIEPVLEPQHNSNHEATQATRQSCFHHEYLILQFAYLKDNAIKGICQLTQQIGKAVGQEQSSQTA